MKLLIKLNMLKKIVVVGAGYIGVELDQCFICLIKVGVVLRCNKHTEFLNRYNTNLSNRSIDCCFELDNLLLHNIIIQVSTTHYIPYEH